MPKYHYKARDMHGKAVSGTIEKTAEAEVARHFKQMGYVMTQITEVTEKSIMFSTFVCSVVSSSCRRGPGQLPLCCGESRRSASP